MRNIVFLLIGCLCTYFVYRDTKKLNMRYRNLWVISTFMLPIVFFPLYLIRSAQVQHQEKLSKRQLREVAKRKASDQRKEKARKEKEQWERENSRHEKENAAKKQVINNEQHEMRLEFEEKLNTQQQRHAKRWGIHKE